MQKASSNRSLGLEDSILSSVSEAIHFDIAEEGEDGDEGNNHEVPRKRLSVSRIQQMSKNTKDIQNGIRQGRKVGDLVSIGHRDSLRVKRGKTGDDLTSQEEDDESTVASYQSSNMRMASSWADYVGRGEDDSVVSSKQDESSTAAKEGVSFKVCSDPLEVSLRVEDLVQPTHNQKRLQRQHQRQQQQRLSSLASSCSNSIGSSLGTVSDFGDSNRSEMSSTTMEKFFGDTLTLQPNSTQKVST